MRKWKYCDAEMQIEVGSDLSETCPNTNTESLDTIAETSDCDDEDANINPAVSEDCSGFNDKDCDGKIVCEDEDCKETEYCEECIDKDKDGYGAYGNPGDCEHDGIDCDDNNDKIHPGGEGYSIERTCENDIDDDCDGLVDDEDSDCLCELESIFWDKPSYLEKPCIGQGMDAKFIIQGKPGCWGEIAVQVKYPDSTDYETISIYFDPETNKGVGYWQGSEDVDPGEYTIEARLSEDMEEVESEELKVINCSYGYAADQDLDCDGIINDEDLASDVFLCEEATTDEGLTKTQVDCAEATWDCSMVPWGECDEETGKRTREICTDEGKIALKNGDIENCCDPTLPEEDLNKYCKCKYTPPSNPLCGLINIKPPTEASCVEEPKFPAFSSLNFIFVILLLIIYYVFLHRKKLN